MPWRRLGLALAAALAACDGPADPGPRVCVAAPALVDGGIDAPDPGWPAPSTLTAIATQDGALFCRSIAGEHVAWVTNNHGRVDLFLDEAHHATLSRMAGDCDVVENAAGHLVAAFRGFGEDGIETIAARPLPPADASQILAADRDGGVLVVRGESDVRELARLTAGLALDPDFEAAPLPAYVDEVVIQGTPSAPRATLRMKSLLRRVDLRTGATDTDFGGGEAMLGFGLVDLLAIAPLADDGLALISRGPEAEDVTIHRLDACGGRAAPQIVTLPFPPQAIATDARGRVTFGFDVSSSERRYLRIDAHTGAVDPTFGTGGRATVVMATPSPCGQPDNGFSWVLDGALDGGSLLFTVDGLCQQKFGAYDVTTYYRLD